MKKRHKKMTLSLVFWFSVLLVFLAASGMIVLYAAGFKFDFKTNKFLRTGLISIVSEPRDAKVYLDGKLKAEKTPVNFSYLSPGEYLVEVKKEDYHPWKKQIRVKSGIATKEENIILFLKNISPEKIASNVKSFSVSPDVKKILYLKNNLRLYSLESFETTSIKISINPDNFEFLKWSNNSQKILIRSGRNYFVFDFEQNKKINLDLKKLNPISKIFWHPKDNNNIFIFAAKKLYSLDLSKENKIEKLAENIEEVAANNKNLFWLKKEKQNYLSLFSGNFSAKSAQKLEENLPVVNFQILAQNSHLALLNSKKELFIWTKNELQEISQNINEAVWSEKKSLLDRKSNKLLFKTDLDEIWYWDMEKEKSYLVSRFSKIIKNIGWYPKKDYILFQTIDEIHIIEPDGQNNIKIAPGLGFELSAKGENLIYLDLKNNLKILKIR